MLISSMILCGIIEVSAQDDTIYVTRPTFTKTIFLEDNMRKTCECVDKNGLPTDDDNFIDSCNTFFVHVQEVYNSDSTSGRIETRYKTLLATYKKKGDGWRRWEYDQNGIMVEHLELYKNPDRSWDTKDSTYIEDFETGNLILEVCTHYSMKKK